MGNPSPPARVRTVASVVECQSEGDTKVGKAGFSHTDMYFKGFHEFLLPWPILKHLGETKYLLVMRGFSIYCDHQGRLYDSHFTDGNPRLAGMIYCYGQSYRVNQEDSPFSWLPPLLCVRGHNIHSVKDEKSEIME